MLWMTVSRDLVLEQDVIEILTSGAEERIDDDLDPARANRFPVDEWLKPLEIARFRIELVDEFGSGKEGVVVVCSRSRNPGFDPVGELVRREDAVGGVDFEPVVLGRVVAAGEDHPGGCAQLGTRRRRAPARGHRGLTISTGTPSEAMSSAGSVCELFGQHAGVEADENELAVSARRSEGCR